MRKLITPFLIVLPALIVFAWLHWPQGDEMSASWIDHYLSYANAGSDETLGPLYRIQTLEGGWFTFWRDAFAAWGVLWVVAIFVFMRLPVSWRWMFVILFLGCFLACMVSYDKLRLWYRMDPIMGLIIVWVVIYFTKRIYTFSNIIGKLHWKQNQLASIVSQGQQDHPEDFKSDVYHGAQSALDSAIRLVREIEREEWSNEDGRFQMR